uniref:Aerolysin-like protein n=1 Tax=Gadus morhua TaxID=8049 RepID=A0A8C5BK43_GADMO
MHEYIDLHFCFRSLTTGTTMIDIGGDGGVPFAFHGLHNGATLKKIGVAVGGWQIKAVRAELTDGRVGTFGRSGTFHKEFTFSPSERITELSLWGNGVGTRLGGIRFWTSSGNKFEAYMNDWGLKTEYSIDVGSGVCLGLEGRFGHDIDKMGFRFINAIQSSVLTDMTYPSLAVYTPQVNKEYIKSLEYKNGTTAEEEDKFTYSRSVTKSTTWSTTNKFETTFSLTVTAGIPNVAEVSAGFSLTEGAEQTSSMTKEETITESDEVTVTVKPGKTVKVEASVGRAVIELPYSATLKITCLNGSELQFQTTGNYNGVAYTAVTVESTESTYVKKIE